MKASVDNFYVNFSFLFHKSFQNLGGQKLLVSWYDASKNRNGNILSSELVGPKPAISLKRDPNTGVFAGELF